MGTGPLAIWIKRWRGVASIGGFIPTDGVLLGRENVRIEDVLCAVCFSFSFSFICFVLLCFVDADFIHRTNISIMCSRSAIHAPRVSISCPVMSKTPISYDDKVNAAALPPSLKHYWSPLDTRKNNLRSLKMFTLEKSGAICTIRTAKKGDSPLPLLGPR